MNNIFYTSYGEVCSDFIRMCILNPKICEDRYAALQIVLASLVWEKIPLDDASKLRGMENPARNKHANVDELQMLLDYIRSGCICDTAMAKAHFLNALYLANRSNDGA